MTSNKTSKKSSRSRRPLGSLPQLARPNCLVKKVRPAVAGQVLDPASTENIDGSSPGDNSGVPELSDDPLASLVGCSTSLPDTGVAVVSADPPGVDAPMPVDVQGSDSDSVEGDDDEESGSASLMPPCSSPTRVYCLTDRDANAFPSLTDVDKATFLRRLSVEDLARLCDGGLITFDVVGAVLYDRLEDLVALFALRKADVLEMLKWTEGVIAGSAVLALLFPGLHSIGGLDVFVGAEFSSAAVAFFRRKGYTKVETTYSWGRGCRTERYRHPPSKIYGSKRPSDEPLKEIHEMTNAARSRKVTVFVSPSRSVLPLLRCPTTLCMNYISHHGVVVLHRLTLSRIGLKNYPGDEATSLLSSFYAKYQERGFQIWDKLNTEHDCSVDERCPLKVRSLFDDHVVHFKWPQYKAEVGFVLRQQEADIMLWRSGAALACDPACSERYGFYICNNNHRVLDF